MAFRHMSGLFLAAAAALSSLGSVFTQLHRQLSPKPPVEGDLVSAVISARPPPLCSCSNGAPLSPCKHGRAEGCRSCDKGFTLDNDALTCKEDLCQCDYGKPLSPCPAGRTKGCKSCDQGFTLDAKLAVCRAGPPPIIVHSAKPSHQPAISAESLALRDQQRCECEHGVAISPCPGGNMEGCSGCEPGFALTGDEGEPLLCKVDLPDMPSKRRRPSPNQPFRAWAPPSVKLLAGSVSQLSLFAAIISRPENVEGRNLLRQMHNNWRAALPAWQITVRFVICTGGMHGTPSPLVADSDSGDMMMMPTCMEDYRDLKRKVFVLMDSFLLEFAQSHKWFMKGDDDTFISSRGAAEILQPLASPSVAMADAFMGKRWTNLKPPKGGQMSGGCGYIMNRELVLRFRSQYAFHDEACWFGEDKCISIWMDNGVFPQQSWTDWKGKCHLVNEKVRKLKAADLKKPIAPIMHGMSNECLECFMHAEFVDGAVPTLGQCRVPNATRLKPLSCRTRPAYLTG